MGIAVIAMKLHAHFRNSLWIGFEFGKDDIAIPRSRVQGVGPHAGVLTGKTQPRRICSGNGKNGYCIGPRHET